MKEKTHKESQLLGKVFNYPSYDSDGRLDVSKFKQYSDIMVFLNGGEVHVGYVYVSLPSKYACLHYTGKVFSVELEADNLIGWIELYNKSSLAPTNKYGEKR